MTEPLRRRWSLRLAYLGAAAALLTLPLVPLATVPRAWAMPDILLALTLGWAARRPDTLPVLAVAAVFLLADMLFYRPPGLQAALTVAATEALRARSAWLRRSPFATEWLAVAAALAAVILGGWLLLALAAVPQAPIGLTLGQLLLTVAIYPLVAGLAHLALGLRRGSGEGDAATWP